MSLQLSDLSVLAYANNFTLWHYKTEDSSVTTAGYFDNGSDMMNIGDMIITNLDVDGTPVTEFYIATDISNGTVTVTAYT